MTIYGYTSRNIPSPKVFEDVLERRMKAKAKGDKATANALKLVVNTTFGASLNQYNDLYDPLMGRSVCITGQLFLFELANHLHKSVEGLKIVQLNTDGIMVEFDDLQIGEVTEIVDEWQQRTGFELEEDKIQAIYQGNVNSYIEVQTNGTIKAKGGLLVRGISTAGAFKINNNAPIIPKAIQNYLVHGIEPEVTIGESTNILDFQIIAKASSKYSKCYQEVDGDLIEVQKCNRVYATEKPGYGTLYKRHAKTQAVAKVGGLPEKCLVDNDNTRSIDEIDRSWYEMMAWKYIRDFQGITYKVDRRKVNKIKEEILNMIGAKYGRQTSFNL